MILLLAVGLWFRRLDGLAQRLVDRVREVAQRRGVDFVKALFLAGAEVPGRVARAAEEKDRAEAEGRLVPDLEHARKERQGAYVHLALFAVVQGALQLALWHTPLQATDLLVFGRDPARAQDRLEWIRHIWTTVLVVDVIWSFSYTWWDPKLKPADPPPGESTQPLREPAAPGHD